MPVASRTGRLRRAEVTGGEGSRIGGGGGVARARNYNQEGMEPQEKPTCPTPTTTGILANRMRMEQGPPLRTNPPNTRSIS